MKKIFLENWANSFNTARKITRFEFWFFLIVNYFLIAVLSLVVGGFMELSDSKESILNYLYGFLIVLFLVPICTAAIRKLNDINKSKLFLLIPFYNIFLLSQKGVKQNNIRIGNVFQIKMLLRIFLGTILIGVAIFILLILFENNTSTNEAFGGIVFSLFSIPIALLLVLLLLLFNKKQMSKKSINATLLRAFLIILPFILIISHAAIQ